MEWLEAQSGWLWWGFAASVLLLVASPIIVAWVVVRLPRDYFANERRRPLESLTSHPVLRPVVLVLKNVLGVVLVAAGAVMLVVPGQGLLTMVIGVLLVDFPGKYWLERWLVTRAKVWRSINWLRRRFRCAEFERPKSFDLRS
jgi:hypothetical protein